MVNGKVIAEYLNFNNEKINFIQFIHELGK